MGGGGTGASGTGGGGSGTCEITDTLEMSSAISTVGIVTFTTDFSNVESASIDFGLDTSYGMTAPVDLTAANYRTLLLGMKPARDYHYRISVSGGGETCTGPDKMLTTGPPPNQPRLINVDIETPQPDKVDTGFTVSGHFPSGPAFIIDGDGEYVWWFDSGDATRVRMSYDGKYMWIRNANVMGGVSEVKRVSMDGLEVTDFGPETEFADGHHDLAPLPDGSIAFITHEPEPGECDQLMLRSPTGDVTEIINSETATGSAECHMNAVRYVAEDDTLTFSDMAPASIVKVTRTGDVVWVLGGPQSTFTGDGAMWSGAKQHGHQMVAMDRLLLFANGATGENSIAYEVQLDFTANTASVVWQYDGGESTPVLGDVQRLPNGNTLIVYTSRGTLDEVDADGNLVRRMVWDLGGATTYLERRASLYGPTPLQ